MKILIAIDGSTCSIDGIDMVASRPWPRPTTVQVVSVVEPGAFSLPAEATMSGAASDPQKFDDEEKTAAQSRVDTACQRLERHGISAQGYVRVGKPAEAIVDEAREWSADLIVLGACGLSGLEKMLVGSVAHDVVAHAPCSVEVVVHKKARAA